jgi:hypothetical protein
MQVQLNVIRKQPYIRHEVSSHPDAWFQTLFLHDWNAAVKAGGDQGDQIVRIFDPWVIVFFV